MKELKVGQSCEVVKVISSDFTDKSFFKVGGFTTGIANNRSPGLMMCMGNGSKTNRAGLNSDFMGTHCLNMYLDREVKLVGRLTITKVK